MAFNHPDFEAIMYTGDRLREYTVYMHKLVVTKDTNKFKAILRCVENNITRSNLPMLDRFLRHASQVIEDPSDKHMEQFLKEYPRTDAVY